VELEMTDAGTDELGAFARADGWLWVDGTRIYEARNLAMRTVPVAVTGRRVGRATMSGG
jgi:hypothetical protein